MINANRTAKALNVYIAKPIKTTVARPNYLAYAGVLLLRAIGIHAH